MVDRDTKGVISKNLEVNILRQFTNTEMKTFILDSSSNILFKKLIYIIIDEDRALEANTSNIEFIFP